MRIQQIAIDKIKPYSKNNRIHSPEQIQRIADSIKEFGFNQPLVVDENNEILVGHGRLFAAQKLNLKELPCVKLEKLTTAQKRAYRILDNKLQNDSLWDFDSLAMELDYLQDEGLDFEKWGLNDLKDLMLAEGGDPGTSEDDFEETEQIEIYIKRGDIMELGPHRIMCGDSTSDNDIESLMRDSLAQIVITDPPYGVDYAGGATTKRDKLIGDTSTALYEPTCANAFKYSDDKSPLYLFHPGIRGYSAAAAAAAAAIAAGYEIRCELIWNKDLAQYGALSAQYKQKHEPFYYCFKEGKPPRWFGPTNEVTVWDCNRASKNEFHPTQKPIELIGRALKNSSQKDNIAADFFLGSGTTLIAADQLGRICYGMEIEPKYCQVIIDRYERHCVKVGKSFECKINGKEYVKEARPKAA